MSGDHDAKTREAFDLWCKSAPEGWVLNTPSRWHAWQAGSAQARREALEEVAGVFGEWSRPDSIRLAAGELTAQEMRTTKAVLTGIESRIRALISQEPSS